MNYIAGVLMAWIQLIGRVANGRMTAVSDRWYEMLTTDSWTVNADPAGYERVRRSRAGGRPRDILARVIMAAMLGRPITSKEHVHHKDGDQVGNNRDENLELISISDHVAEHNRRGRSLLGAAGQRKPTSGAYRTPNGKWVAHFQNKHLGRFESQAEAVEHYRKVVSAHEKRRRAELGIL